MKTDVQLRLEEGDWPCGTEESRCDMLHELVAAIAVLHKLLPQSKLAERYTGAQADTKAVYQIPTEHENPVESLPYALQRVFYHLQTSDQPVGKCRSL
jgi:hypothetical protein